MSGAILINASRDRSTGRVFFTDQHRREVTAEGSPIGVGAAALSAEPAAFSPSTAGWLTAEEKQYLAAHPALALLLAKAEPPYHHAMVQVHQEAAQEAGILAEVNRRAGAGGSTSAGALSMEQLRDLARKGDTTAAAILAEREIALLLTPQFLRSAAQAGVSEASLREQIRGGLAEPPSPTFTAATRELIRRLGYDPDRIEAEASAEMAARENPAAVQAEVDRMAALAGVSAEDINKYGGDPATK